METAIIVAFGVALGVIGYIMWLMWKELRQIHTTVELSYQGYFDMRDALVPIGSSLNHIREVLTEASRLKALKVDSPEKSDTISERTPPRSVYIPIARRRQFAESASFSPATHDAKVRENNARAIETAG
jgi:hypothetical protein